MRTTKNRFLTYRESQYLTNALRAKKITGADIARINGMNSPFIINKVINGSYRVSDKIKERFANAGIDLNEFMIEE